MLVEVLSLPLKVEQNMFCLRLCKAWNIVRLCNSTSLVEIHTASGLGLVLWVLAGWSNFCKRGTRRRALEWKTVVVKMAQIWSSRVGVHIAWMRSMGVFIMSDLLRKRERKANVGGHGFTVGSNIEAYQAIVRKQH